MYLREFRVRDGEELRLPVEQNLGLVRLQGALANATLAVRRQLILLFRLEVRALASLVYNVRGMGKRGNEGWAEWNACEGLLISWEKRDTPETNNTSTSPTKDE